MTSTQQTTQTTAPVIPSVHVRAVITWLAIFPLVAIGLSLLGPVMVDWNPILRAFALTVVIVPLAVYVVVPRLIKLYVRWATARR